MSSTETREVDFDPSELGYQQGHRHTGVGDRDYKTYLVQIEDTPFWVCYTEALVNMHPTEYSRSIETVGKLAVRPGSLNTDEMARDIESNVAELREQRENVADDNLVALESDIEIVENNVHVLAEKLESYWQDAVGEVLTDTISQHEGFSMRKDLVWQGNVPDALNYEIDWAFSDLGVERTERTRENPLFWEVVREPLREQADRFVCRNCEYWGHLDFYDTDQALAYIEQLLS